MKKECTDEFLHYREIARLVWNLGFQTNPALREYDSIGVYEEAMARLFEGLVLHALGYQGRIEDKYRPGEVADFRVEVTHSEVPLLIDETPPGEPGGRWRDSGVRLAPGRQDLRFLAFFDWNQVAPRDFRLLEIGIQRLDERPELTGRRGLVDLRECSVWLVTGTPTEY